MPFGKGKSIKFYNKITFLFFNKLVLFCLTKILYSFFTAFCENFMYFRIKTSYFLPSEMKTSKSYGHDTKFCLPYPDWIFSLEIFQISVPAKIWKKFELFRYPINHTDNIKSMAGSIRNFTIDFPHIKFGFKDTRSNTGHFGFILKGHSPDLINWLSGQIIPLGIPISNLEKTNSWDEKKDFLHYKTRKKN